MRTAKTLVLPAVFLAAAAAACSSSSSDGGSGPGAVSSVDSTKTASSLSDSEAKQYCEDTQRYYASQMSGVDTKKYGCGVMAAAMAAYSGAKTDAEAQSKCREALDECLKAPEKTDADAGTDGAKEDSCADAKKELEGCSATVDELNKCTADTLAAYKASAGKDFCAEAKAASSEGGAGSSSDFFEQPESCKALAKKCPKAVGGDDAPNDSSQGG